MSLAIDHQPVDWDGIFDGYNSAVDVPFSMFYQDIAEKCSSAKFILTIREPSSWFESLRTMRPLLQNATDDPVDRSEALETKLPNVLPSEFVTIMKSQDPESVISAFKQFNTAVQKTISADRLLVLNVKQGWRPLCEFLGVAIPNEPFPHVNSKEEFPSLLRRMVEREYARKPVNVAH
jgi:hypothetical protein